MGRSKSMKRPRSRADLDKFTVMDQDRAVAAINQSLASRSFAAEAGGGNATPRTCAEAVAMAGFKVGDVVQLKSGGPGMTVVLVDCTHLDVAWFEGALLKGEEFKADCLQPYDPARDPTSRYDDIPF